MDEIKTYEEKIDDLHKVNRDYHQIGLLLEKGRAKREYAGLL